MREFLRILRNVVKKAADVKKSDRIMVLVCEHPELGFVTVEADDATVFVLEFGVATQVAAFKTLKKVLPSISLSTDLQVCAVFTTNGKRFQVVYFDWPVGAASSEVMTRMQKQRWRFQPLSKHIEAAKIAIRLYIPLDSLVDKDTVSEA